MQIQTLNYSCSFAGLWSPIINLVQLRHFDHSMKHLALLRSDLNSLNSSQLHSKIVFHCKISRVTFTGMRVWEAFQLEISGVFWISFICSLAEKTNYHSSTTVQSITVLQPSPVLQLYLVPLLRPVATLVENPKSIQSKRAKECKKEMEVYIVSIVNLSQPVSADDLLK